jgi:hypothetical protein
MTTEQNRRYNPQEHAYLIRSRLDAAIEQFNAGTISEDVFKATLYALGFRGANLACEFRYRDEERHAMRERQKARAQAAKAVPAGDVGDQGNS